MKKELVSAKQVINIMILFILGSTLVAGGNFEAQHDTWIALIFTIILAVLIALVYARLSRLSQGSNLYDMFIDNFGNIIGSIFIAIITIYAIHLGSLVIRDASDFIQLVSLPETPQYFVAIFIGLLSFWTLKHGLTLLGNGSILTLPIVITIILLTAILLIKDMNLNYMRPMFSQPWSAIASSTVAALAFPFAEIVLFTTIVSNLNPKDNPYKVYITSILIAGILLLIAYMRNLLVLGAPTAGALYYPSYYTVGMINIGDFITRIEVLVSANFIIALLAKVCVCFYAACKGIEKLFRLESYKVMLMPIALFSIALSGFVYPSTMLLFDFLDIYSIYAPFIQIGIPLILLLYIEIKRRVKPDKKAQPSA